MCKKGRKNMHQQEQSASPPLINDAQVRFGRVYEHPASMWDFLIAVIGSFMTVVAYPMHQVIGRVALAILVAFIGRSIAVVYKNKRHQRLIQSGVIPSGLNAYETLEARAYRTYLDAYAYNQVVERWQQHLKACALGLGQRMSFEEEQFNVDRLRVLREKIDREIELIAYARSISWTDGHVLNQGAETFIHSNDLQDLSTRLRVEPELDQEFDGEMLAAIKEVDELLKTKERGGHGRSHLGVFFLLCF